MSFSLFINKTIFVSLFFSRYFPLTIDLSCKTDGGSHQVGLSLSLSLEMTIIKRRQNLHPFTVNGDVCIWGGNSQGGCKTPNKQTNLKNSLLIWNHHYLPIKGLIVILISVLKVIKEDPALTTVANSLSWNCHHL